MELKGSKTEANLMAAFAGESQARNKYDCYASRAPEKSPAATGHHAPTSWRAPWNLK